MPRIVPLRLATLAALVVVVVMSSTVYADETGATALTERDKWFGVAATIGVAVAAFGGALGQGRAASAALQGIARNPTASPKLFAPMIIGLALIESLVIYSLVAFFAMLYKIH